MSAGKGPDYLAPFRIWRWRQKKVVAFLAVLWLATYGCMLLFYDNEPISSIAARTERVLVRIINDDLGTIPLAGFKPISDDPFSTDQASVCASSGTFTPAVGSIVEFVRIADGDMRISIFPPGGNDAVASESGSVTASPASGATHFVSAGCEEEGRASRFTVWGPVALGDDIRASVTGAGPQSALLLEGSVEVSARSSDLFGFIPQTLYHVSTIELPTASRVSEVGPDDMPAGALWAGYVAFRKDQDALEFRAQTEARNLKIYLPGQEAGAEQIRIGLMMPLFQDPYLIVVQILFAAFFLVFEKFIAFLKYFSSGDCDRSTRPPTGSGKTAPRRTGKSG